MTYQTNDNNASIFVVLPAAGAGSRVGASLPKQFISIAGKTVLEHTIDCFNKPIFEKIVVALPAEYDATSLSLEKTQCLCITGGQNRVDSVLLALEALHGIAKDSDYVFVHDAARPLLSELDIAQLLTEIKVLECTQPKSYVGVMLVAPVTDTLKQIDSSSMELISTMDRTQVVRALTPQVYPYGLLYKALKKAVLDNPDGSFVITDESMAIESLGYKTKAVFALKPNVKLTIQEDIGIIEQHLNAKLHNTLPFKVTSCALD